MRSLENIILHCSASDHKDHDNIQTITDFHLARHFLFCGYHYFIRKNGTIEIGRPLETQGAHCVGQNEHSVGICLSGNKEFTKDQFKSLKKLCDNLMDTLNIPKTAIHAHNEFSTKTCPNFNVKKFVKEYFI